MPDRSSQPPSLPGGKQGKALTGPFPRFSPLRLLVLLGSPDTSSPPPRCNVASPSAPQDGRTPTELATGGNSRIVDMLKRDPGARTPPAPLSHPVNTAPLPQLPRIGPDRNPRKTTMG